MPPVFIPADKWMPTPASAFGEGWADLHNAYHTGVAWRSFRNGEPTGSTTTFGPISGAHVHLYMSGGGSTAYAPDAMTIFAGSKTRLQTVSRLGTWTDVSRAANYGAANEPAGWRFASVGNDIWATNWLDPVQRRTNNAGLFADGFTGTFRPTPRFLAAIREHLVCANLSNAGRFQDELAWSDADNATLWDPPTGTSLSIAGSKRLVSIPGQITGLVGGQYGFAFKRLGIYLLEYTGTTQVFRPEVFSDSIGCSMPSSIIKTRFGTFFLGGDGFYVIDGLQPPRKISPPEVDRHIFSLFGALFTVPPATFKAVDEDMSVVGAVSANVPVVGWLFAQSAVHGGQNLSWVLFNAETQLWSRADANPNPSMAVSMPSNSVFGLNPLESIATFPWSGTAASFAPLGGNPDGCTFDLRFRPSFLGEMGPLAQAGLKRVCPVFSVMGAEPSPFVSVRARSLLQPGDLLSPRLDGPYTSTLRDSWGWYPFQLPGRYFDVRITTPPGEEWFYSFDGAWLDAEPLQ